MKRIRIATVSYLVDEREHTIAGNLERAGGYVRDAAGRGCDVVCLPEAVTTVNVAAGLRWRAEPRNGAWDRFFRALSKDAGINVIAPYLVREGGCVYSQATVFDRRGRVAGTYRKVQPNGLELRVLTPGDALPVITLDAGRVAVMLCMDVYFPEIARIYALKGAEILFWPTITHGPTQEALLTQARARAMDNSLVVVESNLSCRPPYAPYRGRTQPSTARIIDHNGDVLAATGRRPGLAVADIDLDEIRLTADCVLLRDPDRTREDLEMLMRTDVYAREYAAFAKRRPVRARRAR